MAEDKRPANGIKVSDRLLKLLAVLIGCMIIAAFFIVPKYGCTVTAYKAAHADCKKAEEQLASAQQENEELTAKLEEIRTMTAETQDLMKESFELAAKLEQDISDGKSSKKICYITIDDGPYKRGLEYLDIFDKYGVKATFFLTTANGDKLPDQADISAKSMYPEYLKHGHTIGNHTYSHNYSSDGIYSSVKSFMKAVDDQQKFTEEATGGYVPQIVRFPGGTGMAGAAYEDIAEALRKENLVWVDWTVDSSDSWGSDRTSSDIILKNVKEAAKKQDIMVILFHEWSKPSVEAMPQVIEYLQGEGYIFLPLFPESMMVMK